MALEHQDGKGTKNGLLGKETTRSSAAPKVYS